MLFTNVSKVMNFRGGNPFTPNVLEVHTSPKLILHTPLSPVHFPVEPQNLFPLLLAPFLHLTCGAGAVVGKDLTVSSD